MRFQEAFNLGIHLSHSLSLEEWFKRYFVTVRNREFIKILGLHAAWFILIDKFNNSCIYFVLSFNIRRFLGSLMFSLKICSKTNFAWFRRMNDFNSVYIVQNNSWKLLLYSHSMRFSQRQDSVKGYLIWKEIAKFLQMILKNCFSSVKECAFIMECKCNKIKYVNEISLIAVRTLLKETEFALIADSLIPLTYV